MKTKGLRADFFILYQALIGIALELFVTIILMAAAFFIGGLILTWFHKW